MSAPRTGTKYTYKHDRGLADRATGETELRQEMAELDMPPQTLVKVHDYDADRDMVLVEWTDGLGNPRITSIDLDDFNSSFVKG
jgi:hypothetical protein